MPEVPARLQRAPQPRAPRHARVRPRAAVQVPLLRLQQAPPQRAQEPHQQEAPQPEGAQRQVNARARQWTTYSALY